MKKRVLARAPRLFGLVCTVGLAAAPAAATELTFIDATSEYDQGRPASWAWNAVDGDPKTAWCSRPAPAVEDLTFGLDQATKITHLRVVVGAVKADGTLDKTRHRAKVLAVTDERVRRLIRVKDIPDVQEVELVPPLSGSRFVVEVAEMRQGKDVKQPLCMGEIEVPVAGKAITGAKVMARVKKLNRFSRQLVHVWVDEPSAPERTLTLAVDGTFTFTYEPILDGKPAKVRGKWSATKRAIAFTVGRSKHSKLDTRLTRLDDGERKTFELLLSGDGPSPEMSAEYRWPPRFVTE